jgi:phosphatidate cytidylyltransferase
MAVRIAAALLLGVLFLVVVLQSLPFVLFAFGVVHFTAQVEFAGLIRGVARWRRLLHALVTTSVWLVAALSLSHQLPEEALPVALTVAMLAYSMMAVRRYETDADHRHYVILLRSLLFVTLPLSFIPALITWSEAFPVFILLIGASWGADTGAIFTGKAFGQMKLSPVLSSNKTVEGAVGGMLAAGAIWAAAPWLYPLSALVPLAAGTPLWLQSVALFILGVGVAVFGMYGDLVFSLYKREEGLKDYGRIIPGHGGFLDRFDSMIFAGPVLYLLLFLLA